MQYESAPVLFLSLLEHAHCCTQGCIAWQAEVADLRRQCSELEDQLLVKVTELTEAVKVGGVSFCVWSLTWTKEYSRTAASFLGCAYIPHAPTLENLYYL